MYGQSKKANHLSGKDKSSSTTTRRTALKSISVNRQQAQIPAGKKKASETGQRKRGREKSGRIQNHKGSRPRKQTIPRGTTRRNVAARKAERPELQRASSSSGQVMLDDDVEEAVSMLDDSVLKEPPHEDIDVEDFGNAQFVSAYVNPIYEYLRQLETRHRVDERYMERQLDIQDSMRKVLVNWLIEVSIEFQLMSETLFLAVAILDSYLGHRNVQVTRDKLQLLGMTAMFIASKYEEMWHPPVEDFVFICANTYDREEALNMELSVLQTLDFDVSFVTPLQFLRRFSKAASSDARLHTCCKYFIELSLAQYGMLSFSPSKIAAAAVFLSRKLAGKKPCWTDTLAYYTTYTEEELQGALRSLIGVIRREARASDPSPASDKYAHPDYFKVSTTVLDYYRRRDRNAQSRKK